MDQVSLPDQEAFRASAEIPGDLAHPKPACLSRHSGDLNPPSRQIDKEKHQEPRQALARPCLYREEVRSHHDIPMPGQKLLPGGLPLTLRSRFQAVLPQNVGDSAASHLIAQVGQRSLDSPVAPIPIVSGPADHQPPALVSSAPTAWVSLLAAIIRPGDQPSMPSQERCRHDGGQFMKHTPAQFLGSDRQASALIVVKTQPLASELFAQDAVLFLKIVEGILLALVQPASEGNQQEPKGIESQAHRAIVAPTGTPKGVRNRAVKSFCLQRDWVFGHYGVYSAS